MTHRVHSRPNLSRRAALGLALAALLVGCKPKVEEKPKGPQADLTVQPGLSVFLETDQPIHFSVVAVAPDGKVSALCEGIGRAGAVGATPITKPEGSEVRLRFVVAPAMPKRGESPLFFKTAAQGELRELGKTADVAEILYKDGTKAYAITAESRATRATPKQ